VHAHTYNVRSHVCGKPSPTRYTVSTYVDYRIWHTPLGACSHIQCALICVRQTIAHTYTVCSQCICRLEDNTHTSWCMPTYIVCAYMCDATHCIHVHCSLTCVCTAYCIWSVILSQSPISISHVSFQRNVVKETRRPRSSIEIWDRKNDTPNVIGCTLWVWCICT